MFYSQSFPFTHALQVTVNIVFLSLLILLVVCDIVPVVYSELWEGKTGPEAQPLFRRKQSSCKYD